MTATQTILDLLEKDVKWRALSLCNGNIHDAEDLVQDLAVKVFWDITPYNGHDNLRIKKILFQKLKWLYITQKYETGFIHAPVITNSLKDVYKSVNNDVWWLMQKRDLQTLLSEMQSDCIRLKIEGYKGHEMIPMLGKTNNQINFALMNGRNKIKQHLAA